MPLENSSLLLAHSLTPVLVKSPQWLVSQFYRNYTMGGDAQLGNGWAATLSMSVVKA